MRRYKVNRKEPVKLPSKEAIEKQKDFSRLTHEYDRLVKRPKVPLYRDKKMFVFVIILALMAILIARAMKEDAAAEEQEQNNVESVE